VGNYHIYRSTDLHSLGLPSFLTVANTGNSDATAPTLDSLSFVPDTVDVSTGSANVTVQMHVTDPGSGLKNVFVKLDSPVSSAYQTCMAYPSSVALKSAAVSCSISFPQGSPAGDWTTSISTYDAVGNYFIYRVADLQAAGLSTSVTVTNR
jgi:hypothetical protein